MKNLLNVFGLAANPYQKISSPKNSFDDDIGSCYQVWLRDQTQQQDPMLMGLVRAESKAILDPAGGWI